MVGEKTGQAKLFSPRTMRRARGFKAVKVANMEQKKKEKATKKAEDKARRVAKKSKRRGAKKKEERRAGENYG